MPTFSDLARAAYCPRQLYYARRDGDRGPPPEVRRVRELAFRYPELREADDATLRELPIDRPPAEYRAGLERLARRDDWAALVDPADREVTLDGKDCRGIAHKLLPGAREARKGVEGDRDGTGVGADLDTGSVPGTGVDSASDTDADSAFDTDADSASETDTDPAPTPVLVSPGAPPDRGVWEPQSVRAVAAAKALAWERRQSVERALVEYPAHAVVRTVRLTTRRKAAYRRALRTVRSLDGPPPRLRDRSKCENCEYVTDCGVRTRSLRSLLGL